MKFLPKKIGHSIGLLDVNVMDSVMFAAYSHPCRLEQLYKFDVENIHRLYGCPVKRTPPPKCPEETVGYKTPETVPNVCDIKYDSITMFRGEIFIFKNQVSLNDMLELIIYFVTLTTHHHI